MAGTFEYTWEDGEYALFALTTGSVGGKPFTGRHVIGFDPATDSIRSLGFYSNGVMEDLRYKRAEENVAKGTFSGTVDGKSFSAKLTVTFSENRIVYETDGMKRGGEASPDLSVTFARNED